MKAKVIDTYVNPNGVLVKVFEPAKPKVAELTWKPFEKYSIFNVGHQAMKNGRRGIQTTPG